VRGATDGSLPVGSGRFRDQTRNDDCVAGLFLLLTFQGRQLQAPVVRERPLHLQPRP